MELLSTAVNSTHTVGVTALGTILTMAFLPTPSQFITGLIMAISCTIVSFLTTVAIKTIWSKIFPDKLITKKKK